MICEFFLFGACQEFLFSVCPLHTPTFKRASCMYLPWNMHSFIMIVVHIINHCSSWHIHASYFVLSVPSPRDAAFSKKYRPISLFFIKLPLNPFTWNKLLWWNENYIMECTKGQWFDQLKAPVDRRNLYHHIMTYSFLSLYKKNYALELPFLEIYK